MEPCRSMECDNKLKVGVRNNNNNKKKKKKKSTFAFFGGSIEWESGPHKHDPTYSRGIRQTLFRLYSNDDKIIIRNYWQSNDSNNHSGSSSSSSITKNKKKSKKKKSKKNTNQRANIENKKKNKNKKEKKKKEKKASDREVYYDSMRESVFCLCPPGWTTWTPRIVESLMLGCIPVIIQDKHIRLPFQSEISYDTFSIRVDEEVVHQGRLKDILNTVNPSRIASLQAEGSRMAKHFDYEDPEGVYPLIVNKIAEKTKTRMMRRNN
eukprot:CAMPEP_0170186726 /NCGR_PEP_ID=MMETSP0040_2-20121228/40035_1 /TAXON_ID=641309 /ORGANISM="Lotharella oceanica, Strain CCMP622" /LENGTH=264 /DNA_ID=CAMNT_0010433583 /DNA_START=434 /DNA_END=1229 /DNA_ORIENTATION=-